jgi:glutamine amidotransferase-like uncharacterized protein
MIKGCSAAIPLLAAAIACLCGINCSRANEPVRSSDIALYNGNGVWEESVTAMTQMFHWMGYSVTRVDAGYINDHSLTGFKLLAVPGGDMYQYARDISTRGKDNIRAFVAAGHGYIGICGGAYFAADQIYWRGSQLPCSPLGLFHGSAVGPSNDVIAYPGYGMCRIQLSDTLFPPPGGAESEADVLFHWGPQLHPNGASDLAVLGRYDLNGEIAIGACSFGQGRVFLIGVHPEIEEDSDRDSVTFGDQFDDRGSEWDLMKRATAWCLSAASSSSGLTNSKPSLGVK